MEHCSTTSDGQTAEGGTQMSEPKIDWAKLRHTEGDTPWDAIDEAVAAIVAEPSRWEELARAGRAALDDEDATDYFGLYAPIILGLAAVQLPDEPAGQRHKIADFLLDELVVLGREGYDVSSGEYEYACGRMGPAILPQVLQRIKASPPGAEPDFGLWALLCLATKSTDPLIRQQVADCCTAQIEAALRGELSIADLLRPMDTLAQMQWAPARELIERLGREKEAELQDTLLWADYLVCLEQVRGAKPEYPEEIWDRDPREFIAKQHEYWRKWKEDGVAAGNDELDQDPAMRRAAELAEKFAKSTQAVELREPVRQDAWNVAETILRHGMTYLTTDIRSWTPRDWRELLLEIMPRKITADDEYFAGIAPMGAALVRWLEAEGLVSETVDLAATIEQWGPEIEAAAKDPANWGMAKTIAMQAYAEGVEPGSQDQLDAFVARYNARMMSPLAEPDEKPWIEDEPYVRSEPKIGRNDPCPCGSGKKYKKCCGK
jgi:hypothetical protein